MLRLFVRLKKCCLRKVRQKGCQTKEETKIKKCYISPILSSFQQKGKLNTICFGEQKKHYVFFSEQWNSSIKLHIYSHCCKKTSEKYFC